MKTKILLTLLFFALNNNYTFSQDLKMCTYRDYLTEAEIQKACGFSSYMSNQKAEQVVDNILNNVGLFRNFIIKECPDISNAVAATVKSPLGSFERYIIYDKAFLDRVSGVTGTDWSAISIMAHEIGHHLNGHTLIDGIDNHQAELQADEFSGFVLAKMGADLEESLSAINKYGSVNSTKSHPNKFLRIKSISNGWNKANKGYSKTNDDSNIELYELLNEANIQYKLGNTYEFKRLLERASKKDPNNADLVYNLGVLSYESNDFFSAKNYYEKAIRLDPNYINAYINMSALILQGETKIINEMNSLGTSRADNIRYDVLKDQRLGLYRSVVPYLEKVIQIDESNRPAINTLMNIYSALGNTREYNRLKKM